MEILSHGHTREQSPAELDQRVSAALAELEKFELGRFLVANQGTPSCEYGATHIRSLIPEPLATGARLL
ncbi:MAG: hypothetical protein RL326_1863 [Pseudomonadota bacterium]|jgi:hypothetical protein